MAKVTCFFCNREEGELHADGCPRSSAAVESGGFVFHADAAEPTGKHLVIWFNPAAAAEPVSGDWLDEASDIEIEAEVVAGLRKNLAGVREQIRQRRGEA